MISVDAIGCNYVHTKGWEINRPVLYRHHLMLLDILGTNKFMRDINAMNPNTQGIPDVFPPVRNYTVQDGMNYKFLPYPRQQRFTDRTVDYFLNGVDGEKLKWGNLNSDIYVDPISDNMGVVQRQTMLLLAADEMDKGHVDNARALLDAAQEYLDELVREDEASQEDGEEEMAKLVL